MLDLEPIFEFSRENCVAICSFLVPANLVATFLTLIFLLTQRSISQIKVSATVTTILALTLFLHVATWFIIGVITPVTFILAGLGATCLLINLASLIYYKHIGSFIQIWKFSQKSL